MCITSPFVRRLMQIVIPGLLLLLLLTGCGTGGSTGATGTSGSTPGHGGSTSSLPAPVGQVTEFPVTSGTDPEGITAGPDGNLWFTDNKGTRSGVSLRPAPSPSSLCPQLVANLRELPPGRMATSGLPNSRGTRSGVSLPPALSPSLRSMFPIPAGSPPGRMATSGLLSYNADRAHYADRHDTEFHLPTSNTSAGIIAGPDGNLWFTESRTQ